MWQLKGSLLIVPVFLFSYWTICGGLMNSDVEFISVKGSSSNNDIFETNMKLERIKRGVYALSGLMDFKEDTTDEWMVEIVVLKSRYGNNPYKPTAIKAPKDTLHNNINGVYKRFFMNYTRECAPKAPQIVGKFVPPLTKRRILFTRCIVTTKYFPPMEPGYFKFISKFSGRVNASWEVLAKFSRDGFF
ncbi:uncharacterized protein LOC119675773 [Teleopsis dalmanni]|uniref:uncharacterized protein LOC119675773 n=1 Tax=Teleopsis dalmanni TaxID=139649 RepID=UPI0018CE3ED7|nr:uncharacterized protein LOC119675773 [Teleopsis dalmanni]